MVGARIKIMWEEQLVYPPNENITWGRLDPSIENLSPGVDFINCFAPNANLLHRTLNFYETKKLLKSWAYNTNSLA